MQSTKILDCASVCAFQSCHLNALWLLVYSRWLFTGSSQKGPPLLSVIFCSLFQFKSYRSSLVLSFVNQLLKKVYSNLIFLNWGIMVNTFRIDFNLGYISKVEKYQALSQ